MKESDPKTASSGREVDYLDVEVLPRTGSNAQSGDPDPFIKLISRLLDTFFVIPGTRIRFGLEPIIGLIPFLGDQVTALISAALLYRSVQHRLPKIALVRMALNIFINAIVGMVIFLGDICIPSPSCNARHCVALKPGSVLLRKLKRYRSLATANRSTKIMGIGGSTSVQN